MCCKYSMCIVCFFFCKTQIRFDLMKLCEFLVEIIGESNSCVKIRPNWQTDSIWITINTFLRVLPPTDFLVGIYLFIGTRNNANMMLF